MSQQGLEGPPLRLGGRVLGFPTSQGDGFLHRSDNLNRLFYAREFSKAHDVVHFLSHGTVDLLPSHLRSTFETMSDQGFFFSDTISGCPSVTSRCHRAPQ
jgi:hypothetical protein